MSNETNKHDIHQNDVPIEVQGSGDIGVLDAQAEHMAAIARGIAAANLATANSIPSALPGEAQSDLGGGLPNHGENAVEYRRATSRTSRGLDAGTTPTTDTLDPKKRTRVIVQSTSAEQNTNYKRWLAEQRRLYPKGR